MIMNSEKRQFFLDNSDLFENFGNTDWICDEKNEIASSRKF